MFFRIIAFLLLFLLASGMFSQTGVLEKKPESIWKETTEESLQFFMKDQPMVLIYFYSSYNEESMKMKKILQQSKIQGNPLMLSVNIDTNGGLRKTFQVEDLPSLVILRERKVIYGITGFIDDPQVLSDFVNKGIAAGDFTFRS